MNLRELKYVLIGDDRLSAKLNGVARNGYKAGDALKHQSDRLANLRKNFKEAADEIPGFNRGMALLSNPILLGAGAAVGLAVGIRQATQEAEKFNANFRELANLNLDKSYAELKSLKNLVRDVAFEKGFDQNLTSRAFYDVQSVTGKYGGEVAKIVGEQGEFAKLMKADFNAWIEGTGKAMANYGFGSQQLKEYNRSAFATVKVGSITFDQLAKVQSAYAGAAASAGQSFNAANKMLTVFTLKTKSADEAATLTKSLFNDFTKQTTIDALKKVGINIYDSSGKIKQADKLMIELNTKFKQLGSSDKNIVALKNQFTGSEGLISFVQSATDQTGGLLRTLNDFDATELGLNKALELARKDTDYINEQLKNRTKILMGEIGESFLPIKEQILQFTNNAVGGTRNTWFGNFGKRYGIQEGQSDAVKRYDYIMYEAAKMTSEQFESEMKKLASVAEIWQNEQEKTRGNKGSWWDPKARYFAHYNEAFTGTLFDIMRSAQENRARGIIPVKPGTNPDGQTTATDGALADGLNSVSGGGNAVRNITVNIGKLIETQQINSTTIKESMPEIQRLVEEALIRSVAGTEQMIAN